MEKSLQFMTVFSLFKTLNVIQIPTTVKTCNLEIKNSSLLPPLRFRSLAILSAGEIEAPHFWLEGNLYFRFLLSSLYLLEL